MIIFILKILVAYECTQTDYRVSYIYTHIHCVTGGHRQQQKWAIRRTHRVRDAVVPRKPRKSRPPQSNAPPVQRPPPRQLTPDQVAALTELGLADTCTFKFETDNDLDSEGRLDEVDTVLFRYGTYGPYQHGKVLETEYDEGTYWVKLLCTAEQEEYNMNLSDPDIVPLLPRAS